MWKVIAGGIAGFGAAELASRFSPAHQTVFSLGGFGFTGVLLTALVIGGMVYHKVK